MLVEHNALGIEIEGCFKGHAEGPLGIGALLIIVLALIVMCRRRNPLNILANLGRNDGACCALLPGVSKRSPALPANRRNMGRGPSNLPILDSLPGVSRRHRSNLAALGGVKCH